MINKFREFWDNQGRISVAFIGFAIAFIFWLIAMLLNYTRPLMAMSFVASVPILFSIINKYGTMMLERRPKNKISHILLDFFRSNLLGVFDPTIPWSKVFSKFDVFVLCWVTSVCGLGLSSLWYTGKF